MLAKSSTAWLVFAVVDHDTAAAFVAEAAVVALPSELVRELLVSQSPPSASLQPEEHWQRWIAQRCQDERLAAAGMQFHVDQL